MSVHPVDPLIIVEVVRMCVVGVFCVCICFFLLFDLWVIFIGYCVRKVEVGVFNIRRQFVLC